MPRARLPYRVECKRFEAHSFEQIAGFDCEPAATAYADECQRANPRNKYIVTRNGKLYPPLQPRGQK